MIKTKEITFAELGDHIDKALTISHEAYFYVGGLANLDADYVYLEVEGGRMEAVPVEIVKESKLLTLVEGE